LIELIQNLALNPLSSPKFNLKTYQAYIAFVLFVLFSITFMPVNFWHHHAEDEHVEAMHHHNKAAQHHCELDDYFCNVTAGEHCSHPQHLATTTAKCFSCEFSFVKHYTLPAIYFQSPVAFHQNTYATVWANPLHKALILDANKGPPAV
jgi:hypothetical protein